MIDIDPMKLQLHYIIMDIFMYKIKPLIDNSILEKKRAKRRIICKFRFINKGIDMLNLPRIFRQKRLTSLVNFLKIRIPTVNCGL